SILTILLFVLCLPAMAAVEYDYTIDDNTGGRTSIPLTYDVKELLTYNIDGKNLDQGNSLFIDKEGILYIVDTGNNRVIKSKRDGSVLQVYTGAADKPFESPMDIFVDEDGDMYIADKGNNRIVHLSPEGSFVEEFSNLSSPLLGDDFIFEPNNVCI